MLACVMQMRKKTLSKRTQSIKTLAHRHSHAHARARRGDAVNLGDDIEAAKDVNRGERRARLSAAHKS